MYSKLPPGCSSGEETFWSLTMGALHFEKILLHEAPDEARKNAIQTEDYPTPDTASN